MRYHRVIGIDLGTTYSAVSVWDYNRKDAVMIPSAVGENKLPSVVGLDDEQNVVVGRPAQPRRALDPKDTIIEIKRAMGTEMCVRFRDREYLPQEISAFILAELKGQAEKFIGEEVHDAVITVPAYFNEIQRRATSEAAAIAGLTVQQLLSEPVAAAVSFGAGEVGDDREHICAVYDLGGGTLDVSIIAVRGGEVSVVEIGGDLHLGGEDFDALITKWVLDEIALKHGAYLQHDDAVRARLKQAAELAKRELSTASSAIIDLPFVTATLSASLTLSRAKFDELIEPALQRSLRCLDAAVESAGLKKEEIERVLLVGGSSRIPRVRALLTAHFDHLGEQDIRSGVSPEEAVSRGAALVARRDDPSDAVADKPVLPNTLFRLVARAPSDASAGVEIASVAARPTAPPGVAVAETQVTNAGNAIELHAGRKIVITAGDELRLVVADNEIVLDSAGITIRTSGVVRIQGSLIRLN